MAGNKMANQKGEMYKSMKILPSAAKTSGSRGEGMPKNRLNVVHVPEKLGTNVRKWMEGLSRFYGFKNMKVVNASEEDGCWMVISDRPRKCDIPSISGLSVPEAYELRSSQNGIHIKANDRNGLLYGFATAFQILADKGDCVPVSMIEDAPLYPFRSFQLDLARQPETLDTIKKWIVRMAVFKMNRLGLYLEDAYAYRACPGIAPVGALDADSYREVDQFGRLWGVEVYPMMNCYGHMENFLNHKKYKHLSEGREGKAVRPWLGDASATICASLPEARELLRGMILEWGEVSSSEFLHVGMDECWNFASCPLCRKKARKDGEGKVFLEHLLFLRETAGEAGKKIGIWNDIIYWFPEIIKDIPRDVVLFDWEYGHVPSRRRYCELNHIATDPGKWIARENGFQMVACPSTQLENINSYRRYCDPYPIRGFHFTTWGLCHKFLDECLSGFAYGAEVSWARTPAPLQEFSKSLAGVWFGVKDENVSSSILQSLPNYSDQGNDSTNPISMIKHELSEKSFDLSHRLRHSLVNARIAEGMVKRNKSTMSSIRLNFARTAYSEILNIAVNETVVAIRQLLDSPGAEHLVDSLNVRLCELRTLRSELKANIAEFNRFWKRERNDIPMRHNIGVFEKMPGKLDGFIEIIESFLCDYRKAPNKLGRYWLAIEYAEIDCNYRRVEVDASDNGVQWKNIAVTRDCGTEAYREVVALPVARTPKFIRITVSRVGASAIQNVRIVGWQEEWFPIKIAGTEGKVLNAAHLLRDDSRAILIGEPDTWLAFHCPETSAKKSSVILEMAPYVAYPGLK
ncbi:MAG: family 20 glycosylhydrolase [Victivallales bacterium]